MKHQAYLNRALKSRDPRYARIFGKLGYETTAMVSSEHSDEPPFIPDDWRDLSWQDIRSLAASFSDEKIKTKSDAETVIELEIERRKKAID